MDVYKAFKGKYTFHNSVLIQITKICSHIVSVLAYHFAFEWFQLPGNITNASPCVLRSMSDQSMRRELREHKPHPK